MCSNFLQQMEIDALEQLISQGVKVQGQIVRDGFRTCLMVFTVITRVVTEVVAGGDEVYHHSSARVVAGGFCTHLMRVDRFFLRVGKNLPPHGGHRWSPPTWHLCACMASSHGSTKNWLLPWSVEEDTRGRCVGTAHLCHRETSLSSRGRRTTLKKTDGDMAAGPPPCRTSPRVTGYPWDEDETAIEMRKMEAREGVRRRKVG
jgi:hypothetical protein